MSEYIYVLFDMNDTPYHVGIYRIPCTLVAATQEAATIGSYKGSWSPSLNVDLHVHVQVNYYHLRR